LSKKELREREFEAALDGVANPEDEKPAEAETAKAAPPKGKKVFKKIRNGRQACFFNYFY